MYLQATEVLSVYFGEDADWHGVRKDFGNCS